MYRVWPVWKGRAVIGRMTGAATRGLLVALLIATPALLLPGADAESSQRVIERGRVRRFRVERSQLGQNALAGEYDIQITTAFGSPTQDPTPMWMQRLTCDGSQNQVHYCNPEFDKIVATLNVTSDPAERADLFAKAKAFLDEEHPRNIRA